MKNDFTLRMPARLVFGPGKFNSLPEEAANLRPEGDLLVVIDPALTALLRPRLEKLLAGRTFNLLETAPGEPTVEMVDALAEKARAFKAQLVVGIGGGSAMDAAKAVAALIVNPGGAEQYRGLNLLKNPPPPLIMVPTTAGTGSEVTPTAVLVGQGRKGGINSPFIIPAAAILDPELTLDLPEAVTVATGLDALTHAIESLLSRNSNPFTEPLSLQAARMLVGALPAAAGQGRNLEARTRMLAGSLLAGITLANAGVIAGHSLSYPLGPRYGISHGEANGIILPFLLRVIQADAAAKLARLSDALRAPEDDAPEAKARRVVEFLFSFRKKIGFTRRLRDYGVKKKDFEALADEAMLVAVPIANTPGDLNRGILAKIYEAAW